jgi:predicted metal-dependent hydrolase
MVFIQLIIHNFYQVNIIKTINDPQLGEIIFRKNTRAKNYIIRLQSGTIKVTVPLYGSYTKAKDFFNENRQRLLRKIQKQADRPSIEIDETGLRQKAQSVLPEQLAKLAGLHGFTYSGVKIRKSRSRWGSCSTKKIINLSVYLMLLPEHLIEYVLLHELCHTVQMNHSPAFWNLLNTCTQNKAKEFRREIRKYRNSIF